METPEAATGGPTVVVTTMTTATTIPPPDPQTGTPDSKDGKHVKNQQQQQQQHQQRKTTPEQKQGTPPRNPNTGGGGGGVGRHRRTASEDLTMEYNHNFNAYGGYYGGHGGYPSQISYNPNVPMNGGSPQMSPVNKNNTNITYNGGHHPHHQYPLPHQMPPQLHPHLSHSGRARSWSGNQPYPGMMVHGGMPPHYPPSPGGGVPAYPPSPRMNHHGAAPPSPRMNMNQQVGYSQAGNPLVPVLVDPSTGGPTQGGQPNNGGPPIGGPAPMFPSSYDANAHGGGGGGTGHGASSSRRKRKNAGHRRVHSYSGVPDGVMTTIHMDFPPPPPPPSAGGPPPPIPSGRSQSARGVDFSPRNEFMKLTGGFRQTPQSPRRSPNNGANGSANNSNNVIYSGSGSYRAMSPKQSSLRGANAFKQDDMRVSFSPGTPNVDVNGNPRNLGVYGMNGNGTPTNGTMPPLPSSYQDGAGEAVFLAQKRGSRGKKSPGGSRKMHMRQRSAQLFMEDVKGVEQLPACRDVIFLLMFLFHLLGIVYLGNMYGHEALKYHDNWENDSSVTIIYKNIIYVSCLSGLFAVAISACALFIMSAFSKQIIQIALVLTITLSFAWGTIGIGLSPKKVVPATGIIALGISVAYAFIVWDRIPFAASNLKSGLSGLRANPGAIWISFFFQGLALAWSIYYIYVIIGVYDAIQVGDWELTKEWKIVLYATLGISYYWTYNVLLNIVQVTVAGVIGSWWFTTDGDISQRGSDLNRAFFRSSFYSFGSICFGSLFVGPVRVLRQLSAFIRPGNENASLLCLHETLHCIQSCMASCVDSLVDRFSPWAFTYVGLYGYGFLDAGRHATDLFVKRGWTTIVTDDLVPNVLLMTSLVIGGVTGVFAHFIETWETLAFSSFDEPVITSFLVGLAVGLVVTGVLLGIISSSVNAVIVCFAASPVDFEHNHPALSQEMRTAWREVWPGCMDVVDLRVAVATYMDPNSAPIMNMNDITGGGPHAPIHHSYHGPGSDSGSFTNETRPLL